MTESAWSAWANVIKAMHEVDAMAHDLGTYDGGKLPKMDDDARLSDIRTRGHTGKCFHDEDVVFLLGMVERLQSENSELREGRGKWPS